MPARNPFNHTRKARVTNLFNKRNVAKAYRAHEQSLKEELEERVKKLHAIKEEIETLEEKLKTPRRRRVFGNVSRTINSNLVERNSKIKELKRLFNEALEEAHKLYSRIKDVGKAANAKNALAKEVEEKANSLPPKEERSANASANAIRNAGKKEEAITSKAEKIIEKGIDKLKASKSKLNRASNNVNDTITLATVIILFQDGLRLIINGLVSALNSLAEIGSEFN